MDELLLRRCELRDISELAKLKSLAWSEPIIDLPTSHPLITGEWTGEEWWVKEMENFQTRFWTLIHRHTDEMIAAGGWKNAREFNDMPLWTRGQNAFLYTLVVHPKYREQKYARMMTRIRLADAAKQGYSGALCHVYRGNPITTDWKQVGPVYTEKQTGVEYLRYYQKIFDDRVVQSPIFNFLS